MLKFLSDADVNEHVLEALFSAEPLLDLVRSQDFGPRTVLDKVVLEWAAGDDRVLLTRDRNTMVGHAYDRVRLGLRMPGVVVTRDDLPIALQVEDILIVAKCSLPGEMEDQVVFLPL